MTGDRDKICHCPVCDRETFKRWFGHYPEELPRIRAEKARRKARKEEHAIWRAKKKQLKREYYESRKKRNRAGREPRA